MNACDDHDVPCLGDLLNIGNDLVATMCIQSAGWLVKEQNFGARYESARNAETSFLATRQALLDRCSDYSVSLML